MIPYIEQPSLHLGPVTLYAFGALMATGLLVALAVIRRRASRVGLNPELAAQLATYMVVGGLVGAHLVDRLFYNFGETMREPLTLLQFWAGLSSFGGMFGGLAGATLFFWVKERRRAAWRYLDVVAYAIPAGWFFGRVGCFLAYDHVGVPTSLFIGEVYQDGVVRHNLGLEGALLWLVLLPIVWLLARRPRPQGFVLGLVTVLYAPGRFLLDFLRIGEPRWLGLTVGQYAAVALFAVGVLALAHAHRSARRAAAEPGAQETGASEGEAEPGHLHAS